MRERPRPEQEPAKGREKRGRTRAVAQGRLGNLDLGVRVSEVLLSTPLRTAPKTLERLLPLAPAPEASALLGIDLPGPALPPRDDEVEARAKTLLARALGRERRFGEPTSEKDRVRVSCLAFAAGAPVPFTARHLVELEPGDERVPGAHAGVVGKAVGSSVVVPIALPSVAGQPRAGQRANLVVEVVAAFTDAEVFLDDDDAIRRSGIASTREELLSRARRELEGEAAARARGAQREAVLREARARYPVEVPEASIDGVVHLLWVSAEGPVIERMKVPPEEQQALLEAWQSSAEIREDARVRLWTMALVRAYGRGIGLELTDVAVGKRLLEEAPGIVALPASLLGEVFAKDGREGPRDGVWYLEAADRLVDEVLRSERG